jgi:hypothetical protein
MSLFQKPKGQTPEAPEPDGPIPVTLIDPSKRYDIYCSIPGEDRLYEDVRIVGIRTFEKKKQDFGMALIGGYLELEARSGARMMIPHLRMYMICEHGSQPDYKVLRTRKNDNDA